MRYPQVASNKQLSWGRLESPAEIVWIHLPLGKIQRASEEVQVGSEPFNQEQERSTLLTEWRMYVDVYKSARGKPKPLSRLCFPRFSIVDLLFISQGVTGVVHQNMDFFAFRDAIQLFTGQLNV